MEFLQLITKTDNGDAEVFVNPANITVMRYAISSNPDIKTTIFFGKEHSIGVKQTIFEIHQQIKDLK